MNCPGLAPEDYKLYALGLCEASEAEQIRTHVADGCETCSAELGRSVVFWYQFGLLGTEESTSQPRPELRHEVLTNITGDRVVTLPIRRWSWLHVAAAAVALIAVSALSWYIGSRGFLRRSTPVTVVMTRPAPPVPPQEDIRALRERLDRAEQALAEREKNARAAPAPLITPPSALESALAEARRSLDDARRDLSEQQRRTTALENELQAQRNLLAAATHERESAESGAATAADRIQALTARVQQLERQNAEYRTVIERQRTNVEQNLRLASLLNSPSLRMIKLQSTEKGAPAVGYAFMEGSKVLFYASSLPDLPPGKTYQLWLIRGRAPAIVSGGVFAAGNQQRAIVEFNNPQLVANLTALAVTDEPAGGSPLPTGHKFLVGSVRGS